MNIGKLPNDVLEKIVFNNITHKRNDVISRAGIGEDCSSIDFGEYVCVVSSDPITGATENIGSLSVNVSVNDIASNGAEPVGIMMTLLVPPGTTENEIEKVIKDASDASKKINVEIIGGHTEITDAVNRIVVSNTVIGKQRKEKILDYSKIKENDVILMTKHAGLEGVSIIAYDKENYINNKISKELLEEAKSYINNTSVVKEGLICGDLEVNYMHDATEGGILGAVWETSKAIKKGVLIKEDSISVKEATKEICKFYNIDPLRLISSGSMIIVCKYEKHEKIVSILKQSNIEVNVIGKVIKEGIYIDRDGKTEEINPPDSDELYKVI